MKIVLEPYSSKNNKYLELIKKSLTDLNIDVNSLETAFNDTKLYDETEYFILNWYESLYTNSILTQTKRFIKKYIYLIKLKLSNKKLIWVIHNKVSHDDKYKFYSKTLMKWLAKNSYRIIIHSNESKLIVNELVDYEKVKEKIVYMPHPNYIGAYKNVKDNEIDLTNLNLLFVGAIKPYKNVDLLIEVFNELKLENVTLTLAGKVSSIEYENYINRIIDNNPNIITDFRFIEDDEITGLINKSHMLVLPYDINSSLNSGTIILAFSNAKTVLSPLIGTLKDFENKDLFFYYEYNNISSHKKFLKEKIINIYNSYKCNNEILQRVGMECYKVVEKENSLEKISDIFRQRIFNNNISISTSEDNICQV